MEFTENVKQSLDKSILRFVDSIGKQDYYALGGIEIEKLKKQGMGLYGWVFMGELDSYNSVNDIKESENLKTKYGQYGSNSIGGKTPMSTTYGNNFRTKDAIVFIYHKSFDIINKHNPDITSLTIETLVKKKIPKKHRIKNGGTSTEVFSISPNDYDRYVNECIDKLISHPSDVYDNLKPLRWYQRLFINVYKEFYDDNLVYLLSLSCGKGKSLCVSYVFVELYDKIGGDVFLLTTKPSTLNQYADKDCSMGELYTKEIQEKYHIVYLNNEVNNKFDYVKIKKEAGGKRLLFMSSKQFLDDYLSSLNDNSKKNKKFNESFESMLKEIKLVVSDEGHWGANTEITNEIHRIDDIKNEIKSIFSENVKILYSTATPGSLLFKYNLDRSNQFYLNDDIEKSFAEFLKNPNEETFKYYLDLISNNSDKLKQIIEKETHDYLIKNFF